MSHCKTAFKDHFRNHAKDFRHKKYVNRTELSKFMWRLKDEIITPGIKWNVIEYHEIKTLPKERLRSE